MLRHTASASASWWKSLARRPSSSATIQRPPAAAASATLLTYTPAGESPRGRCLIRIGCPPEPRRNERASHMLESIHAPPVADAVTLLSALPIPGDAPCTANTGHAALRRSAADAMGITTAAL